MKKTLVSLFIVAVMAACGGPGSGDSPTANPSNETELVTSTKAIAHIGVEGMTCAMGCAKAIEKNLNDLSGVKVATVNFEGKEATIEFASGDLSKDELIEVIKSTNGGGIYEVTSFELEELVQNGIESNDVDAESPATEEENKIEVSVSDVSQEIVTEKLNLVFPGIFRALLDLY